MDNLKKLLKETNYLTTKEHDAIKQAYFLAKEMHKYEKRRSGEPYINHPVTVACYLATEHLDASTIIAALLHDVPENSQYDIKDIEKQFGKEVAMFVDGVTKLNKVRIKNKWTLMDIVTGNERRIFEQHVDNLRKMFLAMTKDVRIILLKLADRLHNMQTLKYLPREKQIEIARETLEIYAPIAYRLGMGELKGTLEDLSFPYIYPTEYKEAKRLYNRYAPIREDYIEKVKKILCRELKETNIKCDIHGRKKHIYSFWRKLKRNNYDIDKIYDLVALRIIVENNEECYKVLGLIHKKHRPLIGRIKDYIALPKPNGYQSLHTTVFGPDGNIIEIQIRTYKMHELAEFGVAAHWHYKTNKEQSQKNTQNKNFHIPKQQIDWLEELAKWHEKITDPDEWTKGLTMDFFHDQIFVFSPHGDVFNLPAESTPVDFAYSVHSDVGDKCIGAKVNGKLVKLDHILNNGDIVEIITSKKNTGPKKDWLHFVKSHRAKDYIKSFYNS